MFITYRKKIIYNKMTKRDSKNQKNIRKQIKNIY